MTTINRYNGWELSEQSNGPLVRYEDVKNTVDTHNALVADLERAKSALRAIRASPSQGCYHAQDIATRCLQEISEV